MEGNTAIIVVGIFAFVIIVVAFIYREEIYLRRWTPDARSGNACPRGGR